MGNYIVYKIVNNINGKLYFGITTSSINKRWIEHKCNSKRKDYHLYKSIRKYGIVNFDIEIVKQCDSESEMYELEIELIKRFKSNDNKYGYNNSTGGEVSTKGSKRTKEQRKRISECQKNRVRNPMSAETKLKISEKAKGRDMSKAVSVSANNRIGKPNCNILVVSQYSLSGEFINKFNGYREAAKAVYGTFGAFSALKTGRLKTYKNYIWKIGN